MDEAKLWRLTGMASGLVATLLTRKLLAGVWKRVVGTEPPGNPAAPHTSWSEALVWGAISGAALGVARMLTERAAAGAWKAAAGTYPEELAESRS